MPGRATQEVRGSELGFRSFAAGPDRLAPAERSLLSISPDPIELSSLKPADDGDGSILRLLNPTDQALDARIWTGGEIAAPDLGCRGLRIG